MGVTDLWTVLSPVARKVQLKDLEGQTVAVDLSGWIVESEQSSAQHHIRKAYIRNLFFRCKKLLKFGIKLVFVLEGKPPDVKMDTISQRSQIRYGDARHKTGSAHRAQLLALSKECQELLEILGLPCVQSPGEAESTCAFLNKQKVVDACLTQDGDAFLYGATTVYRRLNIEDKDPHVLAYKMSDIESQLGLNRQKLIALAVLSGCDYSPGLRNVGKETVLKFLKSLQHVDIIERLRSWFKDQKYEALEKKVDAVVKKHSHCTRCQHLGTSRLHQTNGCEACGTKSCCNSVERSSADCKCDWHEDHSVKQQWKLELDLRKKAKEVPPFPPEEVIGEFLNENDKVEKVDVAWTRPKMSEFEVFMSKMLMWKPEESRSKLFPVLTCWKLRNGSIQDTSLMPIKIVKERVKQGADFFEVQWQAEQFEGTPPTTCEPQELFKEKYPQLVRDYSEEHDKKRGKKVTEPKSKDIREFFQVTAKNRNNKEVAVDTNRKEKPAVEQPVALPSESRSRRRVTRARKPVPTAKQTEPVVTLAQYCEKTSVKKFNGSPDSSLDDFCVPLSQRIQEKRGSDRPVSTTTVGRTGNAEEEITRSPRKSPRSRPFTISLSDSLRHAFAEPSPSWSSSTDNEAEKSASEEGCTPPKRKNASHESCKSPDAGETGVPATKAERRPRRRQLSFDTPPHTPSAEASKLGSGVFPMQSTPVSLSGSKEEGSSSPSNACHVGNESRDQSAPLFNSESMISLEDSPVVVKAVAPSVIVISDDECSGVYAAVV